MMTTFRAIIRVGILLLGIFEFMVVMEMILLVDTTKIHHLYYRHALYPRDWFNVDTRLLLYFATALLGMLRVMYATSSGTLGPWVGTTLVHAIETGFVWRLASLQHFNTSQDGVLQLMYKVLHLQVGNINSTLVLVVVPTILLLCVIRGPNKRRMGLIEEIVDANKRKAH